MERIITSITDEGVRVETGQDADEVLGEMRAVISAMRSCPDEAIEIDTTTLIL